MGLPLWSQGPSPWLPEQTEFVCGQVGMDAEHIGLLSRGWQKLLWNPLLQADLQVSLHPAWPPGCSDSVTKLHGEGHTVWASRAGIHGPVAGTREATDKSDIPPWGAGAILLFILLFI